MTDTDDRAVLEGRVRAALRREAVTMFADDAEPVDLPARTAHRSRWPVVAAAALVVALAVLATTLAIRRPADHERAGSQAPRPSSASPRHYPEATGLAGVRVIPAVPLTGGGQIEVASQFPDSPSDTVPLGEDTRFTAHVTYGTGIAQAGGPLVVTVVARGATTSCPPAFLIRPLHAYDIDCTLVADAPTGSVGVSVMWPNGSDRVHTQLTRFTATRLSGLGGPSTGERTLARADGSDDERVDVAASSGRGTMYAACIGGGTVTVTMVGRGRFAVDCNGTATGASLPRLGSTVRVSAPRGQRWRVAVYGP